MHNGLVRDFAMAKRDLALAVDPDRYPQIDGSTDSELLFFLALTFGLEDDPPRAVERTVGLVDSTGRRHGVEQPIRMTVATTDGERVWAFRYSSEGSIPLAPEIAHAPRLGHRLPGIRGVYSHVTPVMIARITTSLQARWQASHHAPTPLPPTTPPRRLTSRLRALQQAEARTINRSGLLHASKDVGELGQHPIPQRQERGPTTGNTGVG